MQKNKVMRIASVLLVLTLLSTCAISGTFAKYVTRASAADTARVAKWGVVITTWNTDASDKSVFASSYGTTVNAGADKVVAPGTETPTDGAIKFSVTGTPEVALELEFAMDVKSDAVVPAGEYLDWTTGNSTTDTFNVASDYYPVVFTLTDKDGAEVAKGNLAAIEAAFEGLSATTVAPNTDLAATYGEYTLTWEWVFESGNDEADTLLGNNAAGIASDAGVVTNLDFEIAITATQIDGSSNSSADDETEENTSNDIAELLKNAAVGEVVALASGEYTLSESVTTQGTVVVEKGNTVSIDLANNTLATLVSADINTPTVTNNGTLTIANGTIANNNATSGNTAVAAVKNVGGELTITNCTVENVSPTSGGSYSLVVDGGNATVTNSTIEGYRGGIALSKDGSIVMNGGTVAATYYYPLYTTGTGDSSFDGTNFVKRNSSKGKAITYNALTAGEGSVAFANCAFNFEGTSEIPVDIGGVYTGFTFNGCTYNNVKNPA